jgi:hypothetical protein
MSAMKEFEIFLELFDSEFEWTEQVMMDNTGTLEEVTVNVEKSGGGTLGKKYEGLWYYTLRSDTGEYKAWGRDLRTGMPHSHKYVARLIAMMYAEGSL